VAELYVERAEPLDVDGVTMNFQEFKVKYGEQLEELLSYLEDANEAEANSYLSVFFSDLQSLMRGECK
jgi:hypothetical protein